MIASVLIIFFSSILLIYWFRYSCLLVLRDRKETTATVLRVQDPRFNFGVVQAQLNESQPLDPLHSALQRDYEVLTYLVAHASGLSLEAFDDRLLVLDYRVMRLWYGLTRTLFPQQARRALGEMASVLAVLTNRVSEQAGVASEA